MTVRLGLGGHLKALIKEPVLVWEGIRAFFAMRRRGSLGPSSSYLGWRVATAYGSDKTPTRPVDMVHYLRWRRQMRGLSKWEQVN
ncbi:MAG: hypothetical protein U9N56_07530 [Actinomycetota bacterium]|nr:hypothetical protein [Actinomycetota bacterium]